MEDDGEQQVDDAYYEREVEVQHAHGVAGEDQEQHHEDRVDGVNEDVQNRIHAIVVFIS